MIIRYYRYTTIPKTEEKRNMKNNQVKAMVKSYVRSLLVACSPLLAVNNVDPKTYAIAVLAAFIAVTTRYLDKSDTGFGLPKNDETAS